MRVNIKNNNENVLRIVACSNNELLNNTIVLPYNLHSKYINDLEKTIIVRYPALSDNTVLKLQDLEVLWSYVTDYCELSIDLCIKIGLDFSGDMISIIKQE